MNIVNSSLFENSRSVSVFEPGDRDRKATLTVRLPLIHDIALVLICRHVMKEFSNELQTKYMVAAWS
jgi:hypothetical protein